MDSDAASVTEDNDTLLTVIFNCDDAPPPVPPRKQLAQAMTRHPFRLRLRPGLLLALLLLLSLGGLWQLALNAADKIDEEVSILTGKMLEQDLLRQRKALSKSLSDYAVWNEMHTRINNDKPDMAWLAANLTGSIYQNLDIDLVLLIDPQDGVLYGLDKGVLSAAPGRILQLDTAQWQSLLRQADRYEPQPNMPGPSLLLRQNVSDSLSGQPQAIIYIVAIQRIVAETSPTPSHGRYLLFAKALDQHALQDMSQANSLPQLALNFSSSHQHNSYLSLQNPQSKTLAYLEWDTRRPGDSMLQRLLPQSLLLLIAMLLLCGLILHFGYKQQQKSHWRSQRLEQQGKALQQLVAARHSDSQVLEEYLDDILPLLTYTLNVGRISIWKFSADQQSLICLAGVDATDSVRFSGDTLTLAQHPLYFSAIREQRYLASDQPIQDERLASLCSYLAEREISALLDAGIMVGGLQHGIICAESRGVAHQWQQDEINFICSAADIIALVMESSARLQAEGELYRQFYYDRFTGLPNRSRLQMQLGELIQQRDNSSGRDKRPIGCLMLSLEGLANINELYGRDSGDQLIRLISERLENLARNGEMVARHADNRFAMLLLDDDELSLSRRTDTLHELLLQPVTLQEQQLFLRLSTGLSIYPYDTLHADELLEHAELALQMSRNDPGGNWVRFHPEMNENWRRRHRIQNDLRQVVARGELSLHYQPYISLKTGKVAGAEALVRWEHPELGRISPADFIPQAEETGLINPIGAWVLAEAIRQAVQWRTRFLSQFVISVNVSLLQLEDARFAEMVASQLATHHLPAEALELEVTEGLALRNTPAIDSNLQKLRAQGIGIAIDDFGTGYASFSYLRRFPTEKLKIDKQFLDLVPDSIGGSNLVRMIVAMGHTLGASVTGEGIENIRQARFLAEHGGDYAQGYLISRPLNASDMERFLIETPTLPLWDTH